MIKIMSDCNITDGQCENCSYIEAKLERVEKDCFKFKTDNKQLKVALEIAANQLEAIAICLEQHGQNINTIWLISEYKKMADNARKVFGKGF